MKKIFVVFCNPKQNSFSESIANSYAEGAKKSKKDVRCVNLYNIDVSYFNYDKELTADIKAFQENILWADEVIFIYPVWWFSIPAKLKSIIERTFMEGVVAKKNPNGFPIPMLKGKKAVIIQTYDMPEFVMRYFAGDLSYKLMKSILGLTGIKIAKRIDFSMLGGSSDKNRKKYLKKVEIFAAKH